MIAQLRNAPRLPRQLGTVLILTASPLKRAFADEITMAAVNAVNLTSTRGGRIGLTSRHSAVW